MQYRIYDQRHRDLFEGRLTEMYVDGALAIVPAANRFYVVRTDLPQRPALGEFAVRADAERFVGLVTL